MGNGRPLSRGQIAAIKEDDKKRGAVGPGQNSMGIPKAQIGRVPPMISVGGIIKPPAKPKLPGMPKFGKKRFYGE